MTFTDILALLALTAIPSGCLNSGTDCLNRRLARRARFVGSATFPICRSVLSELPKILLPREGQLPGTPYKNQSWYQYVQKTVADLPTPPIDSLTPNVRKPKIGVGPVEAITTWPDCKPTHPEYLSQEKSNLNER
jgi:hypothetical protein